MKKLLLICLFCIIPQIFAEKYVIGHWPGGMGVCITSALNHLLYCEKNNLTPTIYWYKTYYHNPRGFNGKQNEWEYYFNQVSEFSYQKGDTVHHYCPDSSCGEFSYKNLSQEKRNLAFALITKYIKLNDTVQYKVNYFYNRYMNGKPTIGIHIRGTDKHTEEKPISPEMAIAQALQYADENTQFFIATDEEKLLKRMLELLQGKKVIYYDCYRSPNSAPLHIQKNRPHISPLGEDVIVEMWIMAKCNILIHSRSNVSSIPLYINPNLEHVTLR